MSARPGVKSTTSIVREVYEDGFPEPKSKRFTYVDDEYAECCHPLQQNLL